jgi:hypothetical protein
LVVRSHHYIDTGDIVAAGVDNDRNKTMLEEKDCHDNGFVRKIGFDPLLAT